MICTVSAALVFTPSLTVSSKVSTSADAFQATVGAVKVGLAAVVLDSVTVGPPVWLQA